MDAKMRSLVNKTKQRVAAGAKTVGKAVKVGVEIGKKDGAKRGLQAFKNNVEPEDSGLRTMGGFGPYKKQVTAEDGSIIKNPRKYYSKTKK